MSPSPRRPGRPRASVPLLAAAVLALLVAGCSGGPSGSTSSASAAPGASASDGEPLRRTPVDVVPLARTTGSPARASWAPWPSALHDARHSGAAPVTGPQRDEEVWRRHLDGGALPAGPVVGGGGLAYLVDGTGTLHAVDLRDGHDAWTADAGAARGR